jgi:hypothetical protein
VTEKFLGTWGENNGVQKRFEEGEGYNKWLLKVYLYGTDIQKVKKEE